MHLADFIWILRVVLVIFWLCGPNALMITTCRDQPLQGNGLILYINKIKKPTLLNEFFMQGAAPPSQKFKLEIGHRYLD